MFNLKLIIKSLKEKKATTRYPYEPVFPSEDFRGKPELAFELCIGCGGCAQVCPSNAITITDDLEKGIRNWTIFYGQCILCGRCEEACPMFAIKQTTEFELAAKKSSDLMHVAQYSLTKCDVCNHYFLIPKREILRATKILETSMKFDAQVIGEYITLCGDCKQKRAAQLIAMAVKPGVREKNEQK